MYDIVILGSGPAGLTAALYCARGGKKTLILAGDKLGGQTAGIAVLENYPGWSGSGLELSEFMKKQAESFGAEVVFASARNIAGDADHGFAITADDGKEYQCWAVIISTGASARKLEIAGARELTGKGVSYCATCDGFFYSDKTVLVIGGGNSALNDALYLSDLAESVKIIYRKKSFARAEQILVDRVNEKRNIECLFNTELKSIEPKADSSDFELIATTTAGEQIVCHGVFVAIGHEANTDYLSEDIKRDDMGRLAQSELPSGVFVAGDVRSGLKMQIATAVGTGCEAAMDAIGFINTRLN
ncbi:MAG: FAD-dependent oxidoreductase [Rickettsiales bacterium]|jgi:thioredoxin reductase (NADPH)|nr:FAD-dependent oxidoreductase [Rickettsiales bacterium]